jgi:HAD superfamily phosphatase (TIGR01668 family)
MPRFLTPDLRVASVLELTPERLRPLGVDALLLDVDCTLKRYRSEEIGPEVTAWLQGLGEAGIGVCLVSNGRGGRIGRLAGKLGLPFVAKALKPFPFGCRRAARRLGFDRRRTAMVGDQLFADVMAGRLAGMQSILVRPIHPEEEPWFTRLKRPLERFLLRRMERDGRLDDRSSPPV